ncbi:MAG: ATP-binding protein [Phormidesmis sp.]
MLTNLLSNAIKFSPEDSIVRVTAQQISRNDLLQIEETLSEQGKLAIESGLEVAESLLLVQVADQGRGIPENQLEIVFKQFEQLNTSDADHQGGTGLGLAICRRIIQQHQGEIWAQSKVGEGSNFFFTLPLVEKTPEDIH